MVLVPYPVVLGPNHQYQDSAIYLYSTKLRQILAKSAVCLFYQSVRFYQSDQTNLANISLLDKARDFDLVQRCLRDAVLAITNVTIHLMTFVEPILKNKPGYFE